MHLFTHAIMSNNRLNELINVIDSLRALCPKDEIVVYDSGGRVDVKCECKKRNVRYVNSNYATSAIQNFETILKNEKSRIFVHHDDDEVNEYIMPVKDFILQEKLQFATCLQFANSSFDLSEHLTFTQKIEVILDLYFFDKNGNCPLISGLYIDNTIEWAFRNEFRYSGRHDDVGIILDLHTRPKSKIFNKPYINYATDVEGENSVKVFEDRLYLSKFLKTLPTKHSNLFALIATIRGPRENHHLLKLFIQLFLAPKKAKLFLTKVISKW